MHYIEYQNISAILRSDYLVLNDGRVLNEILIKEGFAKPYNDVFCEMLPLYQEWSLQAKNSLKGLYSIVDKF